VGIVLEFLRDKRTRALTVSKETLVSLVIPVHNETSRIRPLLESLLVQDHRTIEFVFIDDRSNDGTMALLEDFSKAVSEKAKAMDLDWTVHLMALSYNPGPNFKQYGLAKGIGEAKGSLMLLTDADCRVPSTWVRGMAARMEDPRIGAMVGPVFKIMEADRFLDRFQAFDHAVRYTYIAGTTGIGSPGGSFGNNMIVRREALDAIGGYEAVPYSVTEDAALISQIRSHSSFALRVGVGLDVHVMTQSEPDWRSFVKQTLRWNNGGLYCPDLGTRVNYNYLMVSIALGMLAIPLLPFVPSLWPLPAGVFLAMTFNTIATLRLARSSLPDIGLGYIAQTIFMPIYMAYLTVLGYLGAKSTWKGKTLS